VKKEKETPPAPYLKCRFDGKCEFPARCLVAGSWVCVDHYADALRARLVGEDDEEIAA